MCRHARGCEVLRRKTRVGRPVPNDGLPRKDPRWLEYVREQRCTLCGAIDCEAHHVRVPGYCGTALKPPDCCAVPLCRACHRRIHAQGYGDDRSRIDGRLVYLLLEYLGRKLTVEEEF